MTCQAHGCPAEATGAIETARPTRAVIWTKVSWDPESMAVAPKKAERLCGEHLRKTLTALGEVLA